MDINIPRGTYDLYGNEMRLRNKIVSDIKLLMESYMFEMIETPVFEQKNLFVRTTGEETDIVGKEMYDFLDKKGREMALRPELTAPVARSYVNNKMYATNKNAKFYYYMPAFRYERPQAGRFRQFYQFGVESYAEKKPATDAEIIALARAVLDHFDLMDDMILKINSIGTIEDRAKYNKDLVKYYQANETDLCNDCKNRLTTNPLRLLDCKVCSNKEQFNNPPSIREYINDDSKKYINDVLELLYKLNIECEVDYKLVRGLDYYNDTVFEFVTKSTGLTVCGGGRYDFLLDQISNQSAPAFGFGLGVERLTDIILKTKPGLMEEFNQEADIMYIPLNEEAFNVCFVSAMKLRNEGIKCLINPEIKSLKNSIKQANKFNCVYSVILGEDELEQGIVTIKNLITREEEKVSLEIFENEILDQGEEHE